MPTTEMPEGKIVCIGGDGGELNSLSVKSPGWLVLKLLDQIVGLGETAKKITENIKDNGHQPQGTIG